MSVDADISTSEDLFGKSVTDLQEDIAVSSGAITGTLKYVDGGWDSGTWGADESTGNYLVLHCETEEEGTTITAELVGGVHGPVTLGADGLIIFRVTATTQKVKITASKTGYETVTKTYTLTGVTLGE